MNAGDERILAFEKAHPIPGYTKDNSIRVELDMSPTRYHQLLNTLLDDPAALAAEPVLVNRLRRRRDAARRRRAS